MVRTGYMLYGILHMIPSAGRFAGSCKWAKRRIPILATYKPTLELSANIEVLRGSGYF